MRRLGCFVITLLAVLAAGASAHAATVTTLPGIPSGRGPVVVYEAAPGERNDLSVDLGRRTVTFRDRSAVLTAGAGCELAADGAVACAALQSGLKVLLGDGDDSVVAGGEGFAGVTLDGGAGADSLVWTSSRVGATLQGGPGPDRLTGSSQDDHLVGGAGSDVLDAGPGIDTLTGDGPEAPPAADRLDGGAGLDTVAYSDRRGPVSVQLDAPGIGGAPGEDDQLHGIEAVRGGRGDDHLVGDASANLLFGGPGDDTLDGAGGADLLRGEAGRDHLLGRAGRDVLEGDAGADLLVGGADRDDLAGDGGNDRLLGGAGPDTLAGGGGSDALDGGTGDDDLRLQAGRGEHDLVRCGAGDDRVAELSAALVVPVDCERLAFAYETLRRFRRAGSLRFTVYTTYSDNCRTRIGAGRIVFGLRRSVAALRTSPVVSLRRHHSVAVALSARGLGRYAAVRVYGDGGCRPHARPVDRLLGSVTLAI